MTGSEIVRGDPMLYATQYGLTCYLRRNFGITLNGTTVSQWSDQSGVGSHFTQGTAIRQALYDDGLDFDGTNDFYTGPALSTLISASAFTAFVVCTIDSVGTNTGTAHLNDAIIADISGFWGIFGRSIPSAYVYNWDGSADVATVTPTLGARMVLTARHGGGVLGLRLNNGSEVTAASGDTTNLASSVTIGRGPNGDASCIDGKVYSVVIFNTYVSDADTYKIRSFLAYENGVAL